jgi:hypothetical protein
MVTKSVMPFTATHIGNFAQLLTAKAHFVIATTALWSVPEKLVVNQPINQ